MTQATTTTETTDPLATAERVLDLVRARARDAEAEVTVRRGTEALTRFANSFIHQNVAEETSHVYLRLAVDGRVAGSAMDGPVDDESLARLVGDVLDAARVSQPDAGWPGLAPKAAVLDVDHWDDETAATEPDARARLVADFVRAANGLETAGSCLTNALTVGFANSAGQRAAGRTTVASLDGIARTGTSDGSGRVASTRISELDGRAAGERAAQKARDAANPTDIEPGRYEVVLEPFCVANVLQFLFIYGFNGRAVEEGRSFARLGTAQFDAAITIRDDATNPRQAGVAFDAEGTPKRPIDVVRDGVTSAVLQTRRTAAAASAGTDSTGHAVEGGDQLGALPSNVVLDGGKTSDELVRGIGRGLLVTDFWYTRILDPRTEVVTGLTRNGVWLVEDGRIVRPVANLRFTQSFLDALGPGAVKAVGSDQALLLGGFDGAYLVPSLHLASWNFTGGARG
jgi:predicted Zn-dependent protease